jgi:hypothetical protein
MVETIHKLLERLKSTRAPKAISRQRANIINVRDWYAQCETIIPLCSVLVCTLTVARVYPG